MFYMAMRKILNEAIIRLIAEFERTGKVATGKAIDSLRAVVKSEGTTIIGQVEGIGYIKFLIEGRSPTHTKEEWNGGKGGAPLAPLIEWVNRKGISANPWAVKFKIDTEGFEGDKDLIKGTWQRFYAEVLSVVTNSLQGIVNRICTNTDK